jgi:hypothetical protein
MVATNIGNVPIEDYREIVATQNGFWQLWGNV